MSLLCFSHLKYLMLVYRMKRFEHSIRNAERPFSLTHKYMGLFQVLFKIQLYPELIFCLNMMICYKHIVKLRIKVKGWPVT